MNKGEAFRWAKPNLIEAKLLEGEAPKRRSLSLPTRTVERSVLGVTIAVGHWAVDTVCNLQDSLWIAGVFALRSDKRVRPLDKIQTIKLAHSA